MTRYRAIEKIMSNINDEDVVISSCGYTSRELYRIKDRPRNFYMLGSMGLELALGLGLAYARPDLEVIVISGDGSALMGLNTKALQEYMNKNGLYNLWHYILDNEKHESTGGQPTCARHTNFEVLAYATTRYRIVNVNTIPPRIPLTPKQIKERFENAIRIDRPQ